VHVTRRGSGRPLVLVHGLGGSAHSWTPVLDGLAAHHEVVAPDLPGHGQTPLQGTATVGGLTDALTAWLAEEGLADAPLVGSSLGARMVLEMVRRGTARGPVVALDPGGFWSRGESLWFRATLGPSLRLVRALQPRLPAIAGTAAGRTALLAQVSARPWELEPDFVVTELRGFTAPAVLPVYDDLAHGPRQEGAPRGSAPGPLVIGWGRHDRLTVTAQAQRAAAVFPDARLHWFADSGHFPQWDEPDEVVRVVREAVGGHR